MSVRQDVSFKLGDVEFWGDGFDVLLDAGTSVPPTAPIRLNTAQLSQANGVVAQGITFGAKPITLNCMAMAPDGDVETRVDNIKAALNAHHLANVEELLTVYIWENRTAQVRLAQNGLEWGDEALTGIAFTLNFIETAPTT